jgi:hypothetical protein
VLGLIFLWGAFYATQPALHLVLRHRAGVVAAESAPVRAIDSPFMGLVLSVSTHSSTTRC